MICIHIINIRKTCENGGGVGIFQGWHSNGGGILDTKYATKILFLFTLN